MRGPRRVLFSDEFGEMVKRYGGYERLDPILAPIVDGLYENPYGYPTVEDDWFSLCRYAKTKPTIELPEFIVAFTIEDDGTVILPDIEEAY